MTRRNRVIENEWDLAIATAMLFWPGTSITDGAWHVLEQVQAYQERNKSR